MTLRARRIYYSLAILLFFVVAPFVIATATGWRWSGWRQGFISTGSLVVTASPRATVWLNNKNMGSTPKRLPGLAPGAYQIRLERPGFGSWEHIIQVEPGAGSTIGPVQLFRSPLIENLATSITADNFLASADQGAIVGWSNTMTGASLRLVWPTTSAAIVLPSEPLWITASPHQQRLAIGLSTATLIYSLANLATPWALPPGQEVFWLTTSESIFFRIEDEHLVVYDLLTQSRQVLQAAQSASGENGDIWLSRTVGQTTSIEQRLNTLSTTTATLVSLPGDWRVLGTRPHGVFVGTTNGAVGELLLTSRLSGRVDQIPLGGITAVPPQQTATNPLWFNGVDLLTLTKENEPSVILRSPLSIMSAAWIDPGDILATLDTSGLTIRSVSDQQGRGTLVSYPLAGDRQPILLDVPGQAALFTSNHHLLRLSWQ